MPGNEGEVVGVGGGGRGRSRSGGRGWGGTISNATVITRMMIYKITKTCLTYCSNIPSHMFLNLFHIPQAHQSVMTTSMVYFTDMVYLTNMAYFTNKVYLINKVISRT